MAATHIPKLEQVQIAPVAQRTLNGSKDSPDQGAGKNGSKDSKQVPDSGRVVDHPCAALAQEEEKLVRRESRYGKRRRKVTARTGGHVASIGTNFLRAPASSRFCVVWDAPVGQGS